MNIANLLTAFRLALVPFVILAIIHGNHIRAMALFACAAVSDALDGIAARASGATTRLGAYLDPIADKCLLSGVFVALAVAGLAPWWFVAVVFGRDLYILAAAAFLLSFTTMRSFPPSVWGKVSTFVQIVTVLVWMVRDAVPTPWLDALARSTLWPCAGFTLWSGIHYTWRALTARRPRGRQACGTEAVRH
jgi:cardiolipin synthase (CMP-forming)